MCTDVHVPSTVSRRFGTETEKKHSPIVCIKYDAIVQEGHSENWKASFEEAHDVS